MKIYEFLDYKNYINTWILNQPKGGRGQIKSMASFLRVSTTLLSQVLKGDKHFSLETAAELTEYFGFDENESEYFLLMLDHQRAGSHKLKKLLERKLKKEQEKASDLKNRIKKTRELTDQDKMTFYSSWHYSGFRLMSALPDMNDVTSIAQRLNVNMTTANRVMEFLIETGLCKINQGKITYGDLLTHVGNDSPFVVKHHQNWRIKGFSEMENRSSKNLFYTFPMALSDEATEQIRLLLPGIIEQVKDIAAPSDSEQVRCLNIDWFGL